MTETIAVELIERLKEARERAYAPYSGFHVAAAVVCPDGSSFVGCNVETAHYKSVCAEASALSAMVAGGGRRIDLVCILASDGRPCPPCGDCRQRLREFGDESVEVLIVDDDGRVARSFRLGELLPEAFTGPT